MPPRTLTGLLPAAGHGRRMGRYGYMKELFPLTAMAAPDHEPRPVCDYAIANVRSAGAERCVIVVAPHKVELMRMLEGERQGLALGYAVQSSPEGLPDVVRCARPWLEGSDVALALPDTLIFPTDALRVVRETQLARGSDLVLGVFPVDEPERLGPVEIDAGGVVTRVLDKPGHRQIANSWGVACWSPRFTAFCCDWDEARVRAGAAGERVLGHVFDAAGRAGLAVHGCTFEKGKMIDIGTPAGLAVAIREIERTG